MQGKTINGFELKHPLGVGGMAEVWYAENEIGKPAAVKILNEDLSHIAQIVERFRNEAVVMVKLNHPNIRQVYGYGIIDERPCIVMEYLDGDDLKARLKRGQRFTNQELEKWWNQLADALNYTHRQGIVHRDIKPGNIFVDNDGNIKLLDFGIAKVRESISSTQTGQKLGTLMYMSPEQVKDSKHIDYHTDLYSLAVTFVHLLTGKKPYDSETSSDFEISEQIVYKPLDMSRVPMEWKDFLIPYLNKEADQRPALRHFTSELPKATSALRDEDGTLAETGQPQVEALSPEKLLDKTPTLASETLITKPTDKRRSKKGLWIALAAAVVAAVVVVGFLLRDPYRNIDEWLAESEHLYGAFRMDTVAEDYVSVVDSLNDGYDKCVQALQALRELELKGPDTLEFAPRLRKCDSLDSLYVNNIAAIVDKELIRLSVADDTLTAVARLQQLEQSHCYHVDSTGYTLQQAIERNINILLNAELFSLYRKDSLGVKKYGFIDQEGNIVIEPQFDRVDLFYDGLAVITNNRKKGLINKMGTVIVEPIYDEIRQCGEGMRMARINGRYGFMDRTGDTVIAPKYASVRAAFSEGLAGVKIDEKWGFIDKTGKIVIGPRYDYVGDFSEGLAGAKIDGKWGFVNQSGNMVISPKYDAPSFGAFKFSEGLAAVSVSNRNGYIDRSGNMIIRPKFENSGSFKNGRAPVWYENYYTYNTYNLGFIDQLGNVVIKQQYDSWFESSEDLIGVEKNEKWGFIDRNGNVIIQLQYDGARGFSEGLAAVRMNGKYGYIDKTGKIVIGFQYDGAESFSRGLALVRIGNKNYYINKQDDIVFEYDY